MTRYRLDERGRLFRWDAALLSWLRILSRDDEYEEASRAAVLAQATSPEAEPSAPDAEGHEAPATDPPGRPYAPPAPRAPESRSAESRSAEPGAAITVSVRSTQGIGWRLGTAAGPIA